jgi:hypothetical protein
LRDTGQRRNPIFKLSNIPARYGTAQEQFLHGTGQHRNSSCMVQDSAGTIPEWYGTAQESSCNLFFFCQSSSLLMLLLIHRLSAAESSMPNPECQLRLNAEFMNAKFVNAKCQMGLNGEFLNAKFLTGEWDCVNQSHFGIQSLSQSVPFGIQSHLAFRNSAFSPV